MATTSLAQWRERAPDPFPPPWASAWGDDQYGLWADLELPGMAATNVANHAVVQRMRWIEAGSFDMGSPADGPHKEAERSSNETLHPVEISTGFWLADTACTQALWQTIMGDNPAHFHAENKGGPEHPVEQVDWSMAQAFLQKLATLLPECHATLPTEAEWEYACRAGTTTPFFFGENIDINQVNFYGDYPYAAAKKCEDRDQTVAVKALPANGWGLYQMHGNVWEWCADEWQQDLVGDGAPMAVDPGLTFALDPLAGGQQGRRVIRGGSWAYGAQYARSACRDYIGHAARNLHLGFRLVVRARSQAKPVA